MNRATKNKESVEDLHELLEREIMEMEPKDKKHHHRTGEFNLAVNRKLYTKKRYVEPTPDEIAEVINGCVGYNPDADIESPDFFDDDRIVF